MSKRPLSEQQKLHISQGMKRFLQTPAGKARLDAMKGNKMGKKWAVGNVPWNKGQTGLYTPSPEARQKTGQANSKLVYQFTLAGEFIKEWPSVKSAAMELGIGYTSLCLCAGGRTKSSGGYRWHYTKGGVVSGLWNPAHAHNVSKNRIAPGFRLPGGTTETLIWSSGSLQGFSLATAIALRSCLVGGSHEGSYWPVMTAPAEGINPTAGVINVRIF